MLSSLLLTFIIISNICAKLSVEEEQHTFLSQASCIDSIIQKHFLRGTIIYSESTQNSTKNIKYLRKQILEQLFQLKTWKVLTKVSADSDHSWEEKIEKAVGYILVISSLEDLKDIIMFSQECPTWNPSAYFIISFTENVLEDLEIIIDDLWSFFILNGVIMINNPEQDDVFQIYTWYPYNNNKCSDNISYKLIDSCSNGKLEQHASLFPKKVPKQFNDCTFKVVAIIWPPYIINPQNIEVEDDIDLPLKHGIEIQMLTALGKYFKCKFRYRSFAQPENWGDVHANGTVTGMFSYLKEKRADLALGAIYPMHVLHLLFDYSVQYSQSQYAFVVPLADLEPGWKNFLGVLPLNTFLACCATFIVVAAICKVLARGDDQGLLFHTLSGSYLAILALALNNNVNSKPSYIKVRLIFILWVYMTLNINTFIQCGFMNSYNQPLRKRQIYHEDEIVAEQLNIGGTDIINFLYGSTDDDNSKYITTNYIDLLALDAIYQVAYHKNITTILTRDFLSYISKDLRRRIFVSPENVMSIPIEFLYYKGFPLAPHFNKVISIFMSAGLFERWKFLVHGALKRSGDNDDNKIEIVVTINEISGAFAFWVLGLLVACIVFVLEIKRII